MIRPRKVQGAQWYITLPVEWRSPDSHEIKKGDVLDAHFEPGSVLILNPKDRKIGPIEENLIKILIGWPKLVDTQELVENLKGLVEQLDEV